MALDTAAALAAAAAGGAQDPSMALDPGLLSAIVGTGEGALPCGLTARPSALFFKTRRRACIRPFCSHLVGLV
jgi:hypothetical protein